jgi:cell division septation protein DedD
MSKKFFLSLVLAGFSVLAFSQVSAKSIASESAKKDSLEQSIAYIKKNIPSLTVPAEKRAAFAFLGGVQEQSGNYQDALSSYASAAAIAAGDAPGMPKKSSEQLVLDAVRCALSAGDWTTAQNYLNSAVRNSSDSKIIAYVKLYEQWSILCKAEKLDDTKEAVAMLKTYTTLDSMKAVHPQLLLTLWHITGDAAFSGALKKSFPKTPEAAIVKGEIQTLPAPFWYFVPRTSTSSPDVESASTTVSAQATSTAASNSSTAEATKNSQKNNTGKSESDWKSDDSSPSKTENEKIVRQQLGLFKDKANAESLVEKAKQKGFTAKITTETRPSGTTYYLVVVDENKDLTKGDELRTAGFECYPVFEEKSSSK